MGKLVDRVGVAMGLEFPAGKSMDELNKLYDGKINKTSISVKDGFFNLSGIETKLVNQIKSQSYDKAEISTILLDTITRTLGKSISQILKMNAELSKVLIVGGVASNTYLRDNLIKNINEDCKLFFADKYLATDNACGIALLGKDKYK